MAPEAEPFPAGTRPVWFRIVVHVVAFAAIVELSLESGDSAATAVRTGLFVLAVIMTATVLWPAVQTRRRRRHRDHPD